MTLRTVLLSIQALLQVYPIWLIVYNNYAQATLKLWYWWASLMLGLLPRPSHGYSLGSSQRAGSNSVGMSDTLRVTPLTWVLVEELSAS